MISQCDARRIDATLISGDGIGPGIVDAVQIVPDRLRTPFGWDIRQAEIGGTPGVPPDYDRSSGNRAG